MLDFLKKKKKVLLAPVDGHIMKLLDVEDQVFSSGMMGEGIAIEPIGDLFVSPVDCEISLIAVTKHAIGLKLSNGLEILIHIGLDTVKMNGEGFDILVNEGDNVQVGTPLVKMDINLFKSQGISLVTPMVLLNHTDYDFKILVEQGECIAGQTELITF